MRIGSIAFVAFVSIGLATAGSYSFTTSTGNSVVGGTTFLTGSTCDDCVNTFALPFTFNFYGTAYNSINISSNGNIQFASSNTAFTNEAFPVTLGSPALLAHWDDQYLVNSGQGIFTAVAGSPGSRTLYIEWRGSYFPGTGALDYEVRLYENQTFFDVVFGTVSDQGASATLGVQGSASDFTQFSVNTPGSVTAGTGIRYSLTAVPEPSVFGLVGAGLGLVAWGRWRRRVK